MSNKENINTEQIRQNINNIINQKISIEGLYTQQAFGDLCGVSKTTVGKWCKNTCPTADKIPLICEKLNVSIFELLGIKDSSILTIEEKLLLEKYNSNDDIKTAINTLLKIKEEK